MIEKRKIGTVLLGEGHFKEADLLSYTDTAGNYRQEADGQDFDGHRILWGFEYRPHNYLKESELSGDEWRKGGYMTITRNGISVFKEFCRNPERAFVVMQYMLPRLQDFHYWDELVPGRKIYHRNQPAIIERVSSDGEIIVKTAGGEDFVHPFMLEDKEELENNEWKDTDRVHVLSEHIHWSRKI